MCSKRVFTKSDLNMNYKDYNTIKSGNEILKSVKTQDNTAVLSKFINYNSWQTLSASYFKHFGNDYIEVSHVKSLYESDESFIDEKCEPLTNTRSCYSEKNTLYPYGNIPSKKKIDPFFPSNIYLCKWCNKNKIDKIKKINETNSYLYETNKNSNEIPIYEKNNPSFSGDFKNTNTNTNKSKVLKPLFI